MENGKITNDDIADALINLSENSGFCDEDTAIGFRQSKKKEILKSTKDCSFAKFTNEIRKRQTKKNRED